MTDPTGIDSGAPALLLTTSRALTAADPTAIDSGAPAILLTTSRMVTNELADSSSAALSYAEQTVNACAVLAPPTGGSAGSASGGSVSRPVSHPVKHPARHVTRNPAKPVAPKRTLAFTGEPSLLADAAVLALGGALWFSRRIRSVDDQA